MENSVHYIDTTLEEMKLQSALKQRKVIMMEEFTRESVFKIQYMLNKIVEMDKKIPPKEKVITLVISSYGGCAFSCLSLIGDIERLKEQGYKIITHINSMAMSAGFFVSIVGSYRTMNRHGIGLIHPMSSGTQGSIQSMIDDIEFDKILWEELVKTTIKYTDFTREEMNELTKCKTDKYMLANEMLSKNCIDEVL